MRIAGRKADEADAEGVKTGSREDLWDKRKSLIWKRMKREGVMQYETGSSSNTGR